MKETLSFLRKLVANNNREWFNANKEEYLKIKNGIDILASQIIAAMTDFEPEAARLSPSDCTYRIYRDTRFSADKTPYKTHIGIYINPPHGKKSARCGYYLHLEPGSCLVGGGAYCPETKTLKAIRQSIYDNVEEYLDIINAPGLMELGATFGSDPLKTAPKGFPKDWEHIGLLRPRNFDVLIPLADKTVETPDLAGKVADIFRKIKPYNDFLNYTIDEELHLF